MENLNYTNIPVDGNPFRDLIKLDKYEDVVPRLHMTFQKEREIDLLKHGNQNPYVVNVTKTEQGDTNYDLLMNHADFRFTREHNLPFMIILMSFLSDDEIREYIIRTYINRLNLTTYQKGIAILKYKDILIRQGKLNMSCGGKGVDVTVRLNTMKTLGDMIRCSHTTLSKIEYIAEHLKDEVKLSQLENDEISISKVYADLMLETRGKDQFTIQNFDSNKSLTAEDVVTDTNESTTKPLYFIDEFDKYPIVYIKPPFRLRQSSSTDRLIENLKLMNIEEITNQKFASLFIQIPSIFLSEIMDVIRVWGYNCVDILVVTFNRKIYDTTYSEQRNEFMLVCERNNVGVQPVFVKSKFEKNSIRHDQVIQTIDSIFTENLNKIGIFTENYEGWDTYKYDPDLKEMVKFYKKTA